MNRCVVCEEEFRPTDALSFLPDRHDRCCSAEIRLGTRQNVGKSADELRPLIEELDADGLVRARRKIEANAQRGAAELEHLNRRVGFVEQEMETAKKLLAFIEERLEAKPHVVGRNKDGDLFCANCETVWRYGQAPGANSECPGSVTS